MAQPMKRQTQHDTQNSAVLALHSHPPAQCRLLPLRLALPLSGRSRGKQHIESSRHSCVGVASHARHCAERRQNVRLRTQQHVDGAASCAVQHLQAVGLGCCQAQGRALCWSSTAAAASAAQVQAALSHCCRCKVRRQVYHDEWDGGQGRKSRHIRGRKWQQGWHEAQRCIGCHTPIRQLACC